MADNKRIALVLSEKKLDKVMASFMLAVTARASGMEARIFFTFWGLDVLKKGFKPKLGGFMSLFTPMMEKKMKKLKIATFVELREQARQLGVEFYACSTTLELMGVKKENLIDCKVIGAAGFLKLANESNVQLFI